jgi:hypothetical protein
MLLTILAHVALLSSQIDTATDLSGETFRRGAPNPPSL